MDIVSLCQVCAHAIKLKCIKVGCIKDKDIIGDQMDDIEDCDDFEVQEES